MMSLYPNLIQLFRHLGVETYATEMSFSVSQPERDIEWAGTSLATLFAQRRNLLRLQFWRMLQEILSFNSRSHRLLEWSERNRVSLAGLLDEYGYSKIFREGYLLPTLASVFQQMQRPLSAFAIIRKALRLAREEGGSGEMLKDVEKRFKELSKRIGRRAGPDDRKGALPPA